MDAETVLAATPLHLGAWRVELVLLAVVAVSVIVGPARSRAVRLLTAAGFAVATGLAVLQAAGAAVLPVGPHVVADALTGAARTALGLVGLAAVLALPRRHAAAAPMIALATLGLLVTGAAVTLAGLLLGLVLAGIGTLRAGSALGRDMASGQRLVVVGFAVAAFGGVLWSGLGGDTRFTAIRDGLAARPSLPPVAVPLVLGLLLVGLLLVLLGPLVAGAARPQDPTAAAARAWLVAAPLVPLALVVRRLLLPLPQVSLLAPASWVVFALGAVLALGAFAGALLHRDLAARVRAAAPGQLGLAWLGFALVVPDDAIRAATGGVLLAALAHVAVLLLLDGGRPRRLEAVAITLLLLGLAAIPPFLGWRLRYVMVESLLAGGQHLACGVLMLATLLGYVVYLRPLPALWREGVAEVADRPRAVAPGGRVAAWLLFVLAFLWAWGVGTRWPLGA